MYEIINTSLGMEKTASRLIDAIVQELNFQKGFIAITDHHTKSLRSLAVSTSMELRDTEIANSKHPFKHFDISLRNKENFCVKSVLQKKERMSNALYDVLTPIVSEEEAHVIEQKFDIKTTVVYPITFADKVLGVLVLCLDKHIGFLSRAEVETLKELIEVVGIALERAQIYLALKNANQKLKDLDQLKDEFVSVASHELRTPMTAIKSYLWMALNGKGGELNEKQKYYLDRAYNSTDRLIKLVNDMLNVSRIEAGRVALDVQKIDMNVLIEDTIFEVKPRADELGLKVSLKKDPSLPKVIADPDKIKEVLINLLGNSLKFTPTGGKITVSFELKDGFLVTHVTDTGRGIEKEDLAKLFQKFGLLKGSYTTNQTTQQGTGLGLYICKSIVNLHKGDIWAFSEGRDKGAEVSFTLKIYNERDFNIIKSEQEGKEGKEIIHTGL
jgi:signal transduction histidine kinase